MTAPLLTAPRAPAGAVLWLEDHDAFGSVVLGWLLRQGFDVEWCRDLPSARSALARREWDLLLADIHLPDGTLCLELLEQPPAGVALPPAILVTADPCYETAARAIGLPVRAYLPKPPDFGQLLRLVQQQISSVRRRRVTATHLDALRAHLQALLAPEARLDAASLSALRLSCEHLLAHLPAVPADGPDRLLRAALEDAIAVLHRTRQHFKSHDLARLRARLEQQLALTRAPHG